MSGTGRGLGRGLDALFEGAGLGRHEQPAQHTVPIRLLKPNPAQPRQDFAQEALEELADSIRTQGIIQPLLVRPLPEGDGYQIVAGERRWRAASLAGLAEVPVFVRAMDEQEALAAALIENLQREDLNPLEEAQALQGLRTTLGCTQEELASRLGKSRPAIANALRLLLLPQSAQEDVRAGRLSPGHARCLLSVTDSENAEALRIAIVERGLTVREAEDAAAHWRDTGALPWNQEKTVADGASGVARHGAARERRRTSEALEHLQNRIAESLTCQARITGSERKGRITLSYNTAQELGIILERLGIGQD